MNSTFVRKFENIPSHIHPMPDHVQKASVKLLIDESVCPAMKNFSFLYICYKPGGYNTPHQHTFEQAYFYLSGEALLDIGGEQHTVGPYDTVVIPPGTVHSQKAVGKEPLILVELSAPANRDFFDDKNLWPWSE